MLQKILKLALGHKIIAGIAAVALLSGGYYAYKTVFGKSVAPRYVLAQVQKGTLIVSVSGSGQVSASNQIDVKPKVSGDVTSVNVSDGQFVGVGTLIASIDSSEAEKAVRDAEINLETANLNLDKLKQSGANIDKILEDSFADISNAFLDFPTIITAAQEIILGDTFNPKNQSNDAFYKDFVGQNDDVNSKKISSFVDAALADYRTARSNYDDAFTDYKNTSRYSDAATVEDLLAKATVSAKSLAQALKSEQNILDFLTDYTATYGKKLPSLVATYKSSLRTYIGQVNTHLSNLTTDNDSIQNAPLDIRSQELTIEQRQRTLSDAKDALADYSVRAPLAGVVAKLNVKTGDPASPGTVMATIVASQRIAEISLNEVDIAKIKLKQKVTLTFDAIPDLTIAGEVSQIDTLGTVTQGVVVYNTKIAFDTQDGRVKPGMSVSAAIITDVKQNILLVPNSAVKQKSETTYVEIMASGDKAPRQENVQTGLSNDTMTEVISGLNEGDQVVTQTITASASQTTTPQGTGFRIPGIGGGGGR